MSDPDQQRDALVQLSAQKWAWMAAKDTGQLDTLFHDSATFVHMGGTFGKEQELAIIKDGTIHYRSVQVHDTSVRLIGGIGIVLTTLDLHAVIGGNEVINPFVVTEVFVPTEDGWALAQMSFTRLVTT